MMAEPSRSLHKYFIIGAVLALLILVASVTAYLAQDGISTSASSDFVAVTRGNLELKILGRGLVAPAKVETIQSTISSNQAQLVWILEEGAVVKQSQLIARFDTKPFIDRLERIEQELADLQATFEATEKAVIMKKIALQGRVDAAKRRLEIAKIKEEDQINGTGALRRHALEQNIVQARRNKEIIQTTLDDMDALLEKGYVSRRERDRTANDFAAAADAVVMAVAEMDNFTRFEWPRLLHEAKLVVDAAGEELEQEKLTFELESQRAEGELIKLQRDLATALARRDDARRDVIACEVRAPIAGTLLHREIPRNDGRRKVQIGDAIWFGQGFMEIPDTSEMVIELNVREIDVTKLRKGTPAGIALDALPHRKFAGMVEYIDSLARDEGEHGIRTFRTRVLLKDSYPEIYPGMSASVEMTYDNLQDVLLVPLEALSYRSGNATVRIINAGKTDEIPVQLGITATGKAVVLSGLNEGDHVLLKSL